MKLRPLCTVLAATALSLAASSAFAQEGAETESPFSWEVAATSDYVFRGVSQTDEKPALQAGATYTAPVGFYVGAWASNVDFGRGGPDAEIDTFVGYKRDLGDEFVNLDVMLNRYNYVGGNGSDLAYNEWIGKLTFAGTYHVTLAYTNDVWASGEDGWYYAAGADWELPRDFTLSANISHSIFDRSVARGYTDWGVSVGKAWGNFGVSLGYVGTDSEGDHNFGKLAGDRAVLTLTYGM